ncbi:DNA cytosine methyltransferase [Hongsoonwoonella zoysiae]|uniref:DNA cytosine methyltransferase n=1 Tax=Hongsoonwoonella zoysiae TaxID=2821844 RepID=UPI0024836FC5|nr:DNA cytosine methyltransferase [Hongsoonwoonella zoysiae]
MILTAIESFCGAGGMSVGLRQAGFDVKFAFDNDQMSVETYRHNIAPHVEILDASSVSGAELMERAGLSAGDLDLFSGGPPCQGFSKQRRGAAALDDPRNGLVGHFARLVGETSPKAFLFENVQIFGQKRGRKLIDELSEKLSDYEVYDFFACSSDFGIAQSRGRFLMIGLRKDLSAAPPLLPTSDERMTVKDAIGDLPEPPADYTEHPEVPNHIQCKITEMNRLRISHVPPGGGWREIPYDLRLPCHQRVDTSKGGWPDVYGRLSWDGVCPTITGGFDSFSRGRYAHPDQDRSITPREAARLQGFEDSFRFLGNRADVRRMIGNAVPPPLAKAAGDAIIRSLTRTAGRKEPAYCPQKDERQSRSVSV